MTQATTSAETAAAIPPLSTTTTPLVPGPGLAPLAGQPEARRVRESLTRLLLERVKEPRKNDTFGDLGELLLRDAARERASDVHVEHESDGARVRFRVDGALMDAALISTAQAERIVRYFRAMADLDPVALFKPVEARRSHEVDGEPLDLRLAFAPCLRGEKLTIRLLNPETVEQSLAELGMSETHRYKLDTWLRDMNGMFLVSGKTGSGKTTTLYSILRELKSRDRSIVTIEDPVEYQLDGIAQLELNHAHELTYAAAVKSMLRMDPDYLMLGEIRDADSARSALDASITGRTLLSTLHSRDAVGTITNLRNWGLLDHEICSTLSVIVAQRLVRKLCPKCRKQGPVSARAQRWLQSMSLPVPAETWEAAGCDACQSLGYLGRSGVYEVWDLKDEDFDVISTHAEERRIRHYLADAQHESLLADGLAKAAAGVTTLEEVMHMGGYDSRFPQPLGRMA